MLHVQLLVRGTSILTSNATISAINTSFTVDNCFCTQILNQQQWNKNLKENKYIEEKDIVIKELLSYSINEIYEKNIINILFNSPNTIEIALILIEKLSNNKDNEIYLIDYLPNILLLASYKKSEEIRIQAYKTAKELIKIVVI